MQTHKRPAVAAFYIWWLVAVSFIGVLSLTSTTAHGQDYPNTVRCGSVNGQRSFCRVMWGDARLLEQESRTPCIRGENWDLSSRGIWVTDGCRGTFADATYDRHNHWGNRPHRRGGGYEPYPPIGGGTQPMSRPEPRHGKIVSCDSNDNRRVFCSWPIGSGAHLVEQTSNARCEEGYSYGFTEQGIWAAHGCRGKFDIGSW